MKAEFSQKFKYLGFFMTCGMVFFHCPIIDSIAALGPLDFYGKVAFDSMVRNSVDLLMSYFFAVTGFLFFRDFSMKQYPVKIKNRIFSLLIPFVLWQAIFAVFDTVFKYEAISFAEFLRRTFLLEIWPVDAALWYVYGVFLLALLSPVVYLIIKRKNLAWCIIIAIMLLSTARDKIDIPAFKAVLHYGYVENIVHFFPAYFAGAFYGYHYKDGEASCLIYLVLAVLVSFLLTGMIDNLFFVISLKMLPIALIYLLPPIRLLENRKVYKLSFIMYALHQPLIWKLSPFVLDFYTNYVFRIIPSASVAAVLSRLIFLGIDIGLAALIYSLFSKLSPRFLAMLTGGRS